MTTTTLPAYVVGHAFRTRMENEANGNGMTATQWGRAIQDTELAALRGEQGPFLAALFDYESDHTGEYTQIIGVGIDDPASAPAGYALVRISEGDRTRYSAEGAPYQATAEVWAQAHAADAAGENPRGFGIDIEIHTPGKVDLLVS